MKRFLIICCMFALAALMPISCSHAPRLDADIAWPAPPLEPRIVYERSIHSDADLGRSFFGKIKDFLFGRAEGQMIGKPYGIASDGGSKLYIADTSRKGVIVYDLSGGTAKFFSSLGRHGALLEPVYVIMDNSGNIYVSDTKLGRVAVFDSDFRFSHFIGSKEDFEAPVGMAFDEAEERLYVVDTRQHVVKIFDRSGQYLGEFGGLGDERGEFHYPLTIAIRGGTIYVVDSFHFAVQAFDLDGNYLFSFGPTKVGMGTMARPRDIAIDSDNNIYITDAVRNNVQIYSAEGQLLLTVGEAGVYPGQFRLPAGIHNTKEGEIYIADSVNQRIQTFRYIAQN